MNKVCAICRGEGKYKCPTCFIFYCSLTCCKEHRKDNCEVLIRNDVKEEDQVEEGKIIKKRKVQVSESTVPEEKLELLKNNADVNKLLTNPHLQNLLVTVDRSENAEEIMQKAMQEPIFVEFADACLKVVDPDTPEHSEQLHKTE